ncbi:MAG: DUF5615 family PIN-like protein [Chloroflexota bacterium]|nr:DUF5615 family PIN-like protein [Chloroflexota bacterium]
MKVLFDQNLSFRLVQLLADVYPDAIHVQQVGLQEADDIRIWSYASEHNLIIISKDSDFHHLSLLHGQPPKTVWLRLGNAPTSTIAVVVLRQHELLMRHFTEDPHAAILTLA